MWTNGIMHPDNPLSCGQLDEGVSDLAMYGYVGNLASSDPLGSTNVFVQV